MSQQKIALFGIFRSGTNFTRTVLEWNYECQLTTNLYDWKHGFYPIIVKRSILNYPAANTVFVTKNPFSSINSLYNYYTSNGRNIYAEKDWKGFLRKRFVTYDFFQEGSPQYRFANVVDFWNAMNWNFASAKRPDTLSAHVRYENMLKDPISYSHTIAEMLSLTPRFSDRKEFKVPTRVTKNMGDQPRQNDTDYLTERSFNKTTYTDEEYYDRYDESDMKFVLDNIDMDLVTHLGYGNYIDKAKNILNKNS